MNFSSKGYKVTVSNSTEEAWKTLEELGYSILYCEESRGESVLFVQTEDSSSLRTLPFVAACEPASLAPVDWERQWQSSNGYCHEDGTVHLTVGESLLRLSPGPGFGDASHPTTRLILKMIPAFASGATVLDVGCGSGVLSLFALAAGARFAYGFDCDDNAIAHANLNATLNQMQDSVLFGDEEILSQWSNGSNRLLLLNMISSEQRLALSPLKKHNVKAETWLVSGIPTEEKSKYLNQLYQEWNLSLIEERELEGWHAFRFEY